jgi:hypothetical protein
MFAEMIVFYTSIISLAENQETKAVKTWLESMPSPLFEIILMREIQKRPCLFSSPLSMRRLT